MSEKGRVYIFTNPCIVDYRTKEPLYKIGRTTNLPQRLKDLRTTGVPCPFDCLFACEVDDYIRVEKEIHGLFDDYRISPEREFFSITPKQVANIKALLKRSNGFSDVTETVVERLEAESTEADDPIQEIAEVPEGYASYSDLKHLLDVPETFGKGYFGRRVVARHKKNGLPVYRNNGKTYYRRDIFLEKAKDENILRGENA